MDRKVILLTACVNPNGMSKTALQDTEVRKKQYISALYFYLEQTNLPIVFVENTGNDFSLEFKHYVNNRRLEYISFNGNDYDRSLGKGYGEAIIIQYALRNSKLLTNAEYVIKITGRVKIININEIVDSKLLAFNNVVRCSFLDSRFMITSVIVIPLNVLRKFSENCIDLINDNDNRYFEYVLNDFLCANKSLKLVPFFKPIQIEGISGSLNRPYLSPLPLENLYRNINASVSFYYQSDRRVCAFVFRLIRKLFTVYCKVFGKRIIFTDCY